MIVLATTSTVLQEHYQNYLQPFGMVISINDFQTLQRAITKLKPRFLFIDASMLDVEQPNRIAQLRALSQNIKIVGFGNPLPEDQELAMFCAGMRAYCAPSTGFQQFKKMMMALHQGEVWLSRAKMARLLHKLHTEQPIPMQQMQPPESSTDPLWVLTQREKEIALLIAGGNNNRQIAMALNISERTVKAHLTEIFRKLDLNDRLALAVKITSSARLKAQSQPSSATTVVLDPDTIGSTF